ncbi:MAG: HD domain-containing protein [Halobacteriovoraceae bacterium]|nr:HD domain-containing protein [Halobacteriovoraceae bacterium]
MNFFSVSSHLINVECELDYDLYINSSALKTKEKFIRIFPKGEFLSVDDLTTFVGKYNRIYIPEEQRGDYLQSLVSNDQASVMAKTEVIKDSAIHYLSDIFSEDREFNTEVLCDTLVGCRESVECMVDVLHDYNINQIQELIGELSFHDFYTFDHSINVAMYCISMYKTWKPKASKDELVTAGLGGLLHDLGKIKIPTRILNNPGRLEEDDQKIVNKHPIMGAELLDDKMSKMVGMDFAAVRRVILEHHENWNGTGYPQKIKGEDIHFLARITAIADFFDAVTTKRSYHDAMSTDEALALMEKTSGKKIDPKLFDLLVKNVRKVITKTQTRKRLPDDFDGGRPYEQLPFIEEKANIISSDFTKSEDNAKDHGRVQMTGQIKKAQ